MKFVVAALLSAAVGVGVASSAHAKEMNPRPRILLDKRIPEGPVKRVLPLQPGHRILYVNRQGGRYYVSNFNNSSENLTWLINTDSGIADIPAFTRGDAKWNELMTCVRLMFERFNILVTDEDPGDVPHIECVTAGSPQDIGRGNGVGGIAPFTCGVIERAIVFAFADVYGNNMQSLCETVAQESAHALGLEHEYYCPDPMTYVFGCGAKTFQDYDAACGEDFPRPCDCTGTGVQNSVQLLLAILGTSDPEPPTVRIDSPGEGDTVPPGFEVAVTASDNGRVARVELWVDGQAAGTLVQEPFVFNAPLGLSFGEHDIEVRAYDGAVNMTSDARKVNVQPECSTDEECGADRACGGGRCASALGLPCSNHANCASALCARSPDGNLSCTTSCASADCPSGFACEGATDLCWAGDDGGGCATAPPAEAPEGTGAVLFLIVVGATIAGTVVRRRRS